MLPFPDYKKRTTQEYSLLLLSSPLHRQVTKLLNLHQSFKVFKYSNYYYFFFHLRMSFLHLFYLCSSKIVAGIHFFRSKLDNVDKSSAAPTDEKGPNGGLWCRVRWTTNKAIWFPASQMMMNLSRSVGSHFLT